MITTEHAESTEKTMASGENISLRSLCSLWLRSFPSPPVSDANGQRSLVEMYDRQVYLSHLQAWALYEALGRSLGSVSRPGQQMQGQEEKTEGVTKVGVEKS